MFAFVDIKTIYLICHLLGLALGAGGAFTSDMLYMKSLKDKKISIDEMKLISAGGMMVWIGLLVLTISGLLLMSLSWDTYILSTKFIAKMIVVLIIALNGVAIHHIYLPKMRKLVGKDLVQSKDFIQMSWFLYISGAVSFVSWITATVLGAFKIIPFTVVNILSVYLTVVVVAVLGALVVRKYFLHK